MSLGLRETRSHERRQRRRRLLKWLFMLGCMTAGGVALYQAGATLTQGEVRQLREETKRLSSSVADVQKHNLDLMAAAEQAKLDAQEWQRRYEHDVPKGQAQELYALVAKQLAAGADEERLSFLINSAGSTQSCANAPVTKRFLLKTPVSGITNHSVGFADNAVTIVGEGQSALSAAGQPEAWFDPAKPVTLVFSRLGGEASQVSGQLPLHHSVVIGDSEYRFTITVGESRGFVNVTGDRCKFP